MCLLITLSISLYISLSVCLSMYNAVYLFAIFAISVSIITSSVDDCAKLFFLLSFLAVALMWSRVMIRLGVWWFLSQTFAYIRAMSSCEKQLEIKLIRHLPIQVKCTIHLFYSFMNISERCNCCNIKHGTEINFSIFRMSNEPCFLCL